MDIDFDDILETVIEKKEIEEALKEGPIPIPTSDMKPGEWTAVKVFALIVNPVYTGIGAYPRMVEDERWIAAIVKKIEKFGPHLTLRVMLDSLRQTLAITE